ncbi:MAG: hypothetical protein HC927_05615 [Deltaproteobacteria bacterium]|nr:hypothetical protein [Deltaproteobacteria bacterium]
MNLRAAATRVLAEREVGRAALDLEVTAEAIDRHAADARDVMLARCETATEARYATQRPAGLQGDRLAVNHDVGLTGALAQHERAFTQRNRVELGDRQRWWGGLERGRGRRIGWRLNHGRLGLGHRRARSLGLGGLRLDRGRAHFDHTGGRSIVGRGRGSCRRG